MLPGENRSSHPRVAALAATLLLMGPPTVWAHEEATPEWATTGVASIFAVLFATALLSIWLACCPRFQPLLRCLRLGIGRAVAWAVLGLLSVHLIALPPHLVHHLASPPDEGVKCTLFVQGSTSDQARAEPIPLIVSPSLPGTMADCPAPPALVFPISTRSGRSPPDLCI